jgi:hypothetical protein
MRKWEKKSQLEPFGLTVAKIWNLFAEFGER